MIKSLSSKSRGIPWGDETSSVPLKEKARQACVEMHVEQLTVSHVRHILSGIRSNSYGYLSLF